MAHKLEINIQLLKAFIECKREKEAKLVNIPLRTLEQVEKFQKHNCAVFKDVREHNGKRFCTYFVKVPEHILVEYSVHINEDEY